MYHFEEDSAPTIEELESKAKVFFQVVVHYNMDLIRSMFPKKADEESQIKGTFESVAIGTFNEADEIATDMTNKIHTSFPDSKIREIQPEEQEDEYHIWVSNKKGQPIAKIGVIATDYTAATIH